jgi:hypothetical protein
LDEVTSRGEHKVSDTVLEEQATDSTLQAKNKIKCKSFGNSSFRRGCDRQNEEDDQINIPERARTRA